VRVAGPPHAACPLRRPASEAGGGPQHQVLSGLIQQVNGTGIHAHDLRGLARNELQGVFQVPGGVNGPADLAQCGQLRRLLLQFLFQVLHVTSGRGKYGESPLSWKRL